MNNKVLIVVGNDLGGRSITQILAEANAYLIAHGYKGDPLDESCIVNHEHTVHEYPVREEILPKLVFDAVKMEDIYIPNVKKKLRTERQDNRYRSQHHNRKV